MNEKLTDQEYWEKYYNKASTQKETIDRICSKYDIYWNKWYKSVKGETPKNMIEIGAYPGRYIAYIANLFKLHVTGLDFNSDKEKIMETMKIMNVSNFDYIQADFFNHVPSQKYDLVFSNGFIEHFDDFNRVMDLHLKYLNDNGSLLMIVPNKNYLRKIYGLIYDVENLKVHNLNCMYLSVFKSFAERNNLKIEYLDYDGGFPYSYHKKQENKFKLYTAEIIMKLFKKINPFLAKHPSKYYSSNIIAIFTKK